MTSNFQSAFHNMGEAQMLAVQGNQEIGRLIVAAFARFVRRTVSVVPGLRTRFA